MLRGVPSRPKPPPHDFPVLRRHRQRPREEEAGVRVSSSEGRFGDAVGHSLRTQPSGEVVNQREVLMAVGFVVVRRLLCGLGLVRRGRVLLIAGEG